MASYIYIGVETSKQNGVDISLSSIWSELLQDDNNLNWKVTTSPPMLTIDSSSAMNHSDFHASEVKHGTIIRTGITCKKIPL